MSTSSPRHALKALAAAGLGVILLAGVGGTFALWSDDENLTTGTITNGELSLALTEGSWSQNGEPLTDLSSFRMVPGDELVLTAEVTPTIVGDNLVATLAGQYLGDSGEHWDVVTTLPDADSLTEADSGQPHDIVVTVSLPQESGNESQTAVLDLGNVAITLNQVAPTTP